MTTTSGCSPAWARSKPRAPSASRACSDSAWLSRQPRVLKATFGAGAGSATVGSGERVDRRRLGRVVGPGRRVDADERGGGERLPPGVPVPDQPVEDVVALGAVRQQ